VHAVRLLLLLTLVAILAACGSSDYGDQPIDTIPRPEGDDSRIWQIADPTLPTKAKHKTPVKISGVVVVHVDACDETRNGRSAGSIYVSDLGSKRPYSGISLYNASFVPGNLRVGPGDTLDFHGEFQENQDLPIKFPPGAFLVQIATPIATLR